MPARKRKIARKLTRKPEQSELFAKSASQPENSHLRRAIQNLEKANRHFSHAVNMIGQEAGRARKRGHPIEAAVLDRMAILMRTPPNTVEEWAHNMDLAGRLLCWLPYAEDLRGFSSMELKALMTAFILEQKLEPDTQKLLIRQVTGRPGAPQTTRRLAIRALELHREGMTWNAIARTLRSDWTMVDEPWNSIRRQVQFLRRTIEKCGVRLDPH